MLFHISARSEKTLFLAAPQADPHRTIEFQIEGLENSHHLDHHGAARAVVRCARAGMPGIEVRADHHDLIFLVAPRYLADDVQSIHIAIRRGRLQVQTDPCGHILLH